jgi:hypothetical protein
VNRTSDVESQADESREPVDEARSTLDADGTPKVEATQDEWTEKAHDGLEMPDPDQSASGTATD